MKSRLKYYLVGLFIGIGIILYFSYGQDDLVRLEKFHHVNRLIVANKETGNSFEIRSNSLADYFGHAYSTNQNSGYRTEGWEEHWKVEYYMDNELLFNGAIIRHLRSDVELTNKNDSRYDEYYYVYRVDVNWLFFTRQNYAKIDIELIEEMAKSDTN